MEQNDELIKEPESENSKNPDYWDGDIPWISFKDFNGERRYVGDTEKKDYKTWS